MTDKYKHIKSPVTTFKGKEGKWYHGYHWYPDGTFVPGNQDGNPEPVLEVAEPKPKSKKKKVKDESVPEPKEDSEDYSWN